MFPDMLHEHIFNLCMLRYGLFIPGNRIVKDVMFCPVTKENTAIFHQEPDELHTVHTVIFWLSAVLYW